MNPEAVKWLESLTDEERSRHFAPTVANDGMFQLKNDHEGEGSRFGCGECNRDTRHGQLIVIG